MKKTLLLLAALCAAAPAFAANVTISNLGDLQRFLQQAHNAPYFEGDTVRLTADIDCQGGQFTSGYSRSGTVFKGTFDGQGHRIYNFSNKGSSPGTGNEGKYGVAMFDIARDGAVIKNLTLEGAFDDGAASPDYAAAFVAYAIGKTDGTLGLTLENCHFIGSVTNYRAAAAFVGAAIHGTGAPNGKVLRMKNCTARGTVRSDYSYVVGGLVANGEAVEAEDCSFEGNATCRWTLGGLIGKAVDSSFKRCSFKGALGSGLNILGGKDGGCGGLVGFASNSVFRACSADADIEWNINTDPYDSDGRIDSYNFTADGGAAGVTCGSSAFYDCTAAGTLLAKHGYAGGFVGWTAGAEVFSNCTTSVTLQPDARYSNTHGHGGFASTVASSGALFVDCSTSSQGHNIVGGFFNNQHPRKGVKVGRNTFRRCHVENVPAESAGFCTGAWNCTFEGCTVRGGTGDAGFVYSAGRQPDNQWSSEYSYEQTSTYTDCSVHGTRAPFGFVEWSNYSDKNGHTNVFRRCRAGCLYGKSNESGASDAGFGYTLNKGTLVEDCAAYGIADMGDFDAGFATSVSSGTTIRRSVAAVIPRTTDNRTAGFAYTLYSGAVVEDCYAVYGPVSPAVYGNGYYDYQQGYQGGFVRSCRIGQTEGSLPIRRSFALWPVPATTCPYVGSFAAVTPYSDYSTDYFEDCYRPEESPIGDCNNADADGVDALTKAEFATATAATMPNYDFENVWHAPAAVGASSPYLDASVDENGDFWFLAGVIGAEGRILVNGEEPKEAYPAGAVLTVEAVADNPDMPFAGWIGDGFADPSAQTTTYTVKNVSAIAAQFCTPIYTVDDWTNRVHATYISSDTTAYALMNDLDFTDYIAANGWNYIDGYYAFSGKLFGQGHTIRGLVSTNGYFSYTRALFGKISNGAEIRDLTVESAVYPGSGIDNDYNTVCMAGLVCDVGSGSLVSNCHARVDCHGQFPPWAQNYAYATSRYYGLARNVNGTGIRIIDCTVEGTMTGCSEVAGLIGYADLTGGEIARCSATGYFCATNSRSMPYGRVSGLVGEITLRGGSTVRECFTAGVVDGAYYGSGFAYKIELRDDQSTVRDCYSTAEVVTREGGGINDYGNATGFAQRIEDYNDEGGVTIANCWFGGTARALSGAYGHSYGFAWLLSGDVAFQNCAFVQSGDAAEQMEGTAGVTAIDKDARLAAASWGGYDFDAVWSMGRGGTTPYFAWSLKDGCFRTFAFDEEPGTSISHPGFAVPGEDAAISADAETARVLDTWVGAADYEDVHAAGTTFVADNHRTLRCTWKDAVPTPGATQTVTFDGNGGTPASQTATFDVCGKYSPLPFAEMDGFSFVGWFALPEGGVRITEATTVTEAASRTLYAHWADTRQTVTFEPNGGVCDVATADYEMGEPYGALPVATWDGSAFLGWFDDDGDGSEVTAESMVTDAPTRTLYAHWMESRPIFRFYSKNYKGHFFTINEAEKDDLIANNPNWKYEGVAYKAFPEKAPGTVALHRFYSKNYRGHFFTINEAEKDSIIASNPNWKYEGIAYYVYPSAVAGSVPVYRFWSKRYRHHFYTINEAEKDDLIANNPNWKFEGEAFWALPAPDASAEAETEASVERQEAAPVAGTAQGGRLRAPPARRTGLLVTPGGAGNRDGSSWDNAFAGIQAAVDAVDAAWLAAQDAGEAYAIPTILVADGTYSRVVVTNDIALDVRSVNGAAATVIDGGGTNNCVRVYVGYSYKTTPVFTGFTLRNGNTSRTEDWSMQNGGGAAGGTLVDCVVEDCQGYSGGGTYYTDTVRCVIRRCTATGWGGGATYGGTHRNTLVHDCSTYVAVIYNANLYSCTVADTTARDSYYGLCYNTSRYNCVLWGNIVEGEWADDNDPEDPKFVGGGDYRLRSSSPCLDGGDNFFTGDDYAGAMDLAGNDRVQNGTIDRGCYEGFVEGCRVDAVADGNGSVSPAYIFTNDGAVVTITADMTAFNRAVTQWTTNGVTAAWGGDSLTLAPLAGDVVVTARFERIEWYVDGANGDDSAVGYESTAPFKTIARALEAAAPGETIWVMPGVYPPIDTTGRTVSIAAAGDASDTFIDGGGRARCALLSDETTLTGFTLRNGFFVSGSANDGGAAAKGGTLVECVIKDNIGTYGGGAYGSTLVRCSVTDNCAGDGGGLLNCTAYDSFIGFNFGNQGGGAKKSDLYFCTVVRNRGLVHGGADGGGAYNCVFALNRSANNRPSYNIGHCEGCCFDVPNLYEDNGEWYDETTFTADPLFVDPENGDWRLRAGSPCIDRGDAANAFDAEGMDFDWNARVQGAAPDLGAWESGIEGFVVSVRVDGHGSVSQSTFVVAEGGDVSVNAIEDGRDFLYWLVDGEQVRSGPTLDLQNITADHVVVACFERQTTEVSGGGAALQTAIDAAVDGDTLLVAPGTYSAINATGRVLDIVGADGPESTIIQGSKENMLSGTRAATFGVTMTRPTCSLSGFTITGGYCLDYKRGGGGVFGGDISNCVVRGNEAVMGGGASYATLTHCRIEGNVAHLVGGGTTMCVLENCLVTGNAVADSMRPMIKSYAQTSLGFTLPDSFAGGGAIAYSAADHCTIYGNVAQSATAGGGYWVVLDNTYIAGNETTLDGGRRDIYKSRVAPIHVCSSEKDGWTTAVGFIDAVEDDTFVDAAGGDFRLKATSLCIDGGDDSFPIVADGTDLAGNPRWRAMAPDIGCYEADSIVPDAVTDVAATRSDARTDVEVSWRRSRGAERYAVMRSDTEDFAAAVQIGTADNFSASFADGTAAYATRYWYWIVPGSEAGSGEAGETPAAGYWTTPLALTTDELPEGDAPWLGDLAATGGIGPYEWSVTAPSYAFTTNDACTFTTEGVTVVPYEGYYDASPLMNVWLKNAMPLPFAFPYGGHVYTSVWIHSDGLVAFGENHPDWDDDPYNLNWEGTAFRVTEEQFLQVPAIAVYTHCSYDLLGTIFTDESATIIWEGHVWNGGWGSYVRFGLTLYPDGTFDLKYHTYGNPCLSEPLARYGYSTGDGEGFLARIGEGVSLASAPDRRIRYAPAPAWIAAAPNPAGDPGPGAAAGLLFAAPPEPSTNEVLVAVTDADGRRSFRRYRVAVGSGGSFPDTAVALDPQGGSGGTASVVASFGEALPPIDVPTKAGCRFGGYWTGADGGGTQYYAADGTGVRAWNLPLAEATLYAKWTESAEPEPELSSVFRFYSKNYKGHFFTINEAEKDDLIANNPNWKYEGVAYKAFPEKAPGTVALHRFYSKNYRGHFFTINEAEKDSIIASNPNWKYEGIAYYVYPSAVAGSVPVYRFWSKRYRHHFYTINEAEKDDLIANNPNWKFEGEAFWALPAEEDGRSAQRSVANSMAIDGNDIVDTNVTNDGNGENDGNNASAYVRRISPVSSEGCGRVAPWTLVTWPGFDLVATDGETEIDGVVVKANADAPDAAELGGAGDEVFVSDLQLLLSLPGGAWRATLWSVTDGTVADEDATGVFGFTLPANGVWHWLRVNDAEDEDAFSLWILAE